MQNTTLAERAYEELGARIVSGRLAPGHRLLAEELANQLSISQTPVKEALAELERDGLVEGVSRRSLVVRRFTAHDIAEIYQARMLIELEAARCAMRARRMTSDIVDGLAALCTAQVEQVERRCAAGLAEAIRLDREFHEAIVALGGNAVTARWHRQVIRQTQTIHSYSIERYAAPRSRLEHAAIVDALRAGSVSRVVRALRVHLTASRDEMLSRAPDELPPRPGSDTA